jgi:D-sedoheptulose 7-phosphate isomerase
MDHLQDLIKRYPSLTNVRQDILKAYTILKETFQQGGKLLVAGNGGSAADAEHIVGELMKSFVKKRKISDEFSGALNLLIDKKEAEYLGQYLQPGLPAIALASHTTLTTACINDMDGNIIYAQQVYSYGLPNDVFLGITTSGNSKNILHALITAKAKRIKTIVLTGGTGGLAAQYADMAIIVPETETFKIQELHLPVYHVLCLMLEDFFFP